MRNLLYLAYFILKTNYPDLKTSLNCTSKIGHNRLLLLADMVWSTLRYGSSFVDYFNFRFYEKKHVLRHAYATMGYMYRFHRNFNDQSRIKEVDSKKLFPLKFGKFCNKSYVFEKGQLTLLNTYLRKKAGEKIVIKDPNSTAGRSIRILNVVKNENVIEIGNQTLDEFVHAEFEAKNSLYIEDWIQQHHLISAVSPTGVNTIRMITLLNKKGEVEIIGSVFRISIDCPIDNYSAGNLAAEINPTTGIVIKGGIRKRSSCDLYHDIHPITGCQIKGLQIPFWEMITKMVKEAALIVPEVSTVGWDVAITENGPVIIEGNSTWNKDTWQIPAGFGKKHIIAPYM